LPFRPSPSPFPRGPDDGGHTIEIANVEKPAAEPLPIEVSLAAIQRVELPANAGMPLDFHPEHMAAVRIDRRESRPEEHRPRVAFVARSAPSRVEANDEPATKELLQIEAVGHALAHFLGCRLSGYPCRHSSCASFGPS